MEAWQRVAWVMRGRAGPDSRRRPAPRSRALLEIKEDIPRRTYLLVACGAVGLVFAAWWLAASRVEPIFLAPPQAAAAAVVRNWKEGVLLSDIQASVYRITVGFLISSLAAIPLGILMGTFRIFEAAFEPVVDFIRYMPAVAFVPLTILWFGTSDWQKFTIVFIGTFFQQVLMVLDNVKSISKNLIDVAYTFGLNKWEIVKSVIIPAALPGIVDTLRITLGWAWTYLVVAELVAAREGLGYQIMKAQRYLATDVIIGYIIVIGVIGLCTDYAFKFAYRILFPWVKQSV